jgi:molybdate transport system ATP-binding protein
VIDVAVQLAVHDRHRRFALDITFRSEAPVIALYGPSGAGKSLTLQAMAGLLRPRAGHVRIGTRTLFDSAAGIHLPPERRGTGYLFQHYALFPHLSVRQNVAFGLTGWARRLQAADAARVETLLQAFGLGAVAGSRPATLSGGQQQRVALARALACEPQALLLDEPFAALNPMLRRTLRSELAAARQRAGIPMVLITHDVQDVLALADEVVLVEEGRVRQTLPVAGQDRDTLEQRLERCFEAAA